MPSIVACVALLAGSVANAEDVAQRHLLVKARMLQVNRTKLRELGIDFQRVDANGQPQRPGTPLFEMDTPPGFIEALENHHVAREIDRASILLKMNGKQAEFFQGGQVEVQLGNGPSKSVRFGTEVKVVAAPAEGSNVRLHINFKHSNLDESRGANLAGLQAPGFRIKQIDTAFEAAIGKTVTISGQLERDGANGDTHELLLMVTTEAANDLAASRNPTVAR